MERSQRLRIVPKLKVIISSLFKFLNWNLGESSLSPFYIQVCITWVHFLRTLYLSRYCINKLPGAIFYIYVQPIRNHPDSTATNQRFKGLKPTEDSKWAQWRICFREPKSFPKNNISWEFRKGESFYKKFSRQFVRNIQMKIDVSDLGRNNILNKHFYIVCAEFCFKKL